MAETAIGPVTVRVPVRIDFAGGWSDVHYFAARAGGAVLNAAITPCVEGSARWEDQELLVRYRLALPPGAHLGSSASVDVAWLKLTYGLMGRDLSPVELAEAAYRLEKLLGVAGGRQDQYAAALGGFNVLRFGAEDEPATVERLEVPPQRVEQLERCCLLCYAGRPPAAGSLHERVWERYRRGDQDVAAALRRIRDSVGPARDALLAGDLNALARAVMANTAAARGLDEGIVTPRMDELAAAGAAAGALGAKPCGAGGGGCMLFICADGRTGHVEAALRDHGGRMIPFRFV